MRKYNKETYNSFVVFVPFQAHRNLSQLPNFAFSIALAHFHSSEDNNTTKADDMLQDALLMFPSVSQFAILAVAYFHTSKTCYTWLYNNEIVLR